MQKPTAKFAAACDEQKTECGVCKQSPEVNDVDSVHNMPPAVKGTYKTRREKVGLRFGVQSSDGRSWACSTTCLRYFGAFMSSKPSNYAYIACSTLCPLFDAVSRDLASQQHKDGMGETLVPSVLSHLNCKVLRSKETATSQLIGK